jgi:nucleosome binding factor SPN SPT16 subunit
MFFSDDGSEVEDTKASAKKGANGNPSPLKNKTAGGKVLRNKTRNAGHEEASQTIAAKIGEHQRELHAQLHKNGLAKYSEGGSGAGGKEGQGWKKFQSYKGELGLPKEVESLRVSIIFWHRHGTPSFMLYSDFRRSKSVDHHLAYSWICRSFSHQHDQKRQQE